MESKYKKIQTTVFLVALLLLTIIWAVNGYEQTWFFASLVPVIIPNAWWVELINKLRK